MESQALIPRLMSHARYAWLTELALFLTGLALMTALAQLAVPVPGTPVPVTGQTLGVALIALSWGRKRAPLVMAAYLALGAAGLPVFALKGGFLLGPTFGYLVGMLIASFLVGWLADIGFARGFWMALLAAYVGSVIVLGCGAWGLSFFLPADKVWQAGVAPFLPGDLAKNLIAAWLSSRLSRRVLGSPGSYT